MKKITVAVCLDGEDGMMFNNRRQSRDRVMIAELVNSTDSKIHIHPYSAKLFAQYESIAISDSPLDTAGDGEVVFIEQLPIKEHLDAISRIIIYRWNRLYPADLYFDIDLEASGFKLICKTEFEGSSHEKITKGIYEK